MPLPLAAIGLGLSAAQTILNPILQNAQNQRNREWTKEMYERQRKDALENWRMENEYNSPEQQMQRLKEAGLNPHLVYGSGATATGGSVNSVSPQMAPSKTPEVDTSGLTNSIFQYQQTKASEVSIDRTKQAMEIGDIQKELLQAQIVKTLADAKQSGVDTVIKESMFPTNFELATKRLEQMQVENARKWQQLEQSERMFPVQLANELLKGKLTQEQIDNQPVIRKKLAQDISASLTQQTLTELKKISEQQKQVLFQELQQSYIWKNKLDGIKVTHADQQTELNRLKINMRGAGLSDAALSDIIRSLIGVRVAK